MERSRLYTNFSLQIFFEVESRLNFKFIFLPFAEEAVQKLNNTLVCHPRERGDPFGELGKFILFDSLLTKQLNIALNRVQIVSESWIPAFAGMTDIILQRFCTAS